MKSRNFTSGKRTNASFQIKVIVCLTIAVVAAFLGVIVKSLSAVEVEGSAPALPATGTTVPNDSNKGEISLDPNLSSQIEFAGEAIFSAGNDRDFCVVYNNGERGYVAKITYPLGLGSVISLGGVAVAADLSPTGELSVAIKNATGYSMNFINSDGILAEASRSFSSEKPLSVHCLEGQTAVLFFSEGEQGKRLIFRLYDDANEICERYANVQHSVRPMNTYRIGDTFLTFFAYNSAYNRGAGYAKFTLSTKDVAVTAIERADNYDFFGALPTRVSYALLCSDIDGTFIMHLDEKLNRSEMFRITDYAAKCGKLSFDGNYYYAFLGGENQGKMFRFNSPFSDKTAINSYDAALSVAGEFNTGGTLLHLLNKKNGFFITDTNGLFTKSVHLADSHAVAMAKLGGSVAAVCNLSGENPRVFIGVLN